jgi:hypothetical protein
MAAASDPVEGGCQDHRRSRKRHRRRFPRLHTAGMHKLLRKSRIWFSLIGICSRYTSALWPAIAAAARLAM